MVSALGEEVESKAKRIDSHLHVWASPEEMANEVGKAMFSKAGELGAVCGIYVHQRTMTKLRHGNACWH
ncbi:unnamed protein product [Calypogeia fissa]